MKNSDHDAITPLQLHSFVSSIYNFLYDNVFFFRWKRDNLGVKVKHPESKKHILQFIAIERGDTGEWAIPGVRKHPAYQPASNPPMF